MKVLTKANRISHLQWSPKSDKVAFVKDGEKITVVNLSGSEKEIAQGREPNWLGADNVVFVKNHQIYSVSDSGSGEKLLFGRDTCFAGTSKGCPIGSPDGQKVLFVCRDVKREQTNWVPDNAYPVRHFFAIGQTNGQATPINSSWYGGKAAWLPEDKGFAHSEFDATGGARLHITSTEGKDQKIFRGYYPKVSPDNKKLVVVAHAFDKLLVIDLGDWSTTELPIPEDLAGGRFNNAADWISNTELLLEAKGVVLHFNIEKPKDVERRVKVDLVRRGVPTLTVSPDGKQVVYEAREGEQSELRLVEVSDWLKETLPAPQPETVESE